MAILVDTNVFLAAADLDDADNRACQRVLRGHLRQIVVPAPVVPEAAWMIDSRLGSAEEAKFLRLVISEAVEVIDMDRPLYERCVELVETYADLHLGFVDKSIVFVAEREGIITLATLNHRDFRVVRPDHCEAFELIP